MMEVLVILFGSYLLGSIPSGLLIGLARGVDVRRYGSGKTGAANTLRLLGPRASALVFIADLVKGILPVLVARYLTGSQWVEIAAALAAVTGHNWSIYIRFQGGRGVTTSFGGLTAMSPEVALPCLVAGVGIIAFSRYVSLGSILGSAFAAVLVLALFLYGREPLPYLVYALTAASLIIFQHRDNITRLRTGTERRLGERVQL